MALRPSPIHPILGLYTANVPTAPSKLLERGGWKRYILDSSLTGQGARAYSFRRNVVDVCLDLLASHYRLTHKVEFMPFAARSSRHGIVVFHQFSHLRARFASPSPAVTPGHTISSAAQTVARRRANPDARNTAANKALHRGASPP
jgi:hypothetical protein